MLVFYLVLILIDDCFLSLSAMVLSFGSGRGLFLSFFVFLGDLDFFSLTGDLDLASLLPLLVAVFFDFSLTFFYFYTFCSSFSFYILCYSSCLSCLCFFADAALSLFSASFARLSYLSFIFCIYSDLLSSEMPPFSLYMPNS